ncbi:MAG: thioesterase family protein [Actinomycetota bacterium]
MQRCEAAVLHNGDAVALGQAWRIRTSPEPIVSEFNDFGQLRKPDECPEFKIPWHVEEFYMAAMDLRTAHGNPFQGPSAVWFRMRYPLIAGEEPTPLERVIIAADSGNGISAVLGFDHAFINVDVTTHLVREAEGEWIALDSTTRIDPIGIGASESFLHDERGRIGSANQSLYIDAPRS